MPLFKYRCRECDRPFEILTTGRPDDPVACPSCDAPDPAREFGLPAAGRPAPAATNCRGDGPPCGAAGCGRVG